MTQEDSQRGQPPNSLMQAILLAKRRLGKFSQGDRAKLVMLLRGAPLNPNETNERDALILKIREGYALSEMDRRRLDFLCRSD